MPGRLVFIPITDSQRQTYYCRSCIDEKNGPYLSVPILDQVVGPCVVKINGCKLMTSNHTEYPFYGYRCNECDAEKHIIYFTCANCNGRKKSWCEGCFEKGRMKCMEAEHNFILETKPFSSWHERMSELELSSLKFKDDILANENIFQQGEMYFESHLHAKAIEYYNLYLQQNEANGKDKNLALCDSNLGDVYRDCGEYKKAIECYSKSLDTKKSIYPESHLEIATSFNKFGLTYESLREYSQALKFHQDALDIRKLQCGEPHPETATSYHYIASIYQQLEDFEKAKNY